MPRSGDDEAALIALLRNGDEAAFACLVDLHTPAMLRVARGYVRSHDVAEDVVQETWIALLKGIDGFEGGEEFGSIFLIDDGSGGTFDGSHTGV